MPVTPRFRLLDPIVIASEFTFDSGTTPNPNLKPGMYLSRSIAEDLIPTSTHPTTNFTFDQPTDQVFTFVLWSFTAAVVTLIVQQNPEIKKSYIFQPVSTFFILSMTYAIPAAILGRVIFTSPLALGTDPSGRTILFVEFCLSLSLLAATFLAAIPRYFALPLSGPGCKEAAGLTVINLHHNDIILNNSFVWVLTIVYFMLRFVAVYLFCVASIGCNLAFTIQYDHPTVYENDIVTFVLFIAVLMPVSGWYGFRVNCCQALMLCILILNTFILCYFVANDSYLVQIELAFLAMYLGVVFSIIQSLLEEQKNHEAYNTLGWLWFQLRYYYLRRCKAVAKLDLEDPGYNMGCCSQHFHSLLYPGNRIPPGDVIGPHVPDPIRPDFPVLGFGHLREEDRDAYGH